MYGRRMYPPGPARLSAASTLGVPVPGRDPGMTYVSLYPASVPYRDAPVGLRSIQPRAVHGYGEAEIPISADAPRKIPVTHDAPQRILIQGGLPEPVGYSIFGQPVYAGQALDPTRITDSLQGLGTYVRGSRRGFGYGPDGL